MGAQGRSEPVPLKKPSYAVRVWENRPHTWCERMSDAVDSNPLWCSWWSSSVCRATPLGRRSATEIPGVHLVTKISSLGQTAHSSNSFREELAADAREPLAAMVGTIATLAEQPQEVRQLKQEREAHRPTGRHGVHKGTNV